LLTPLSPPPPPLRVSPQNPTGTDRAGVEVIESQKKLNNKENRIHIFLEFLLLLTYCCTLQRITESKKIIIKRKKEKKK